MQIDGASILDMNNVGIRQIVRVCIYGHKKCQDYDTFFQMLELVYMVVNNVGIIMLFYALNFRHKMWFLGSQAWK